MVTIGERIKEARKYFNLTQKEFGNIVGISYGHLSNIEKNKDNPSTHLLKRIAYEFSINIKWLENGSGDMLDEFEAIEVEPIISDELNDSLNKILLNINQKAQFMPTSEKKHYFRYFFHASGLFNNILEIAKHNDDIHTITEKLMLNLEMLSIKKLNSIPGNDFPYKFPYAMDELKEKLQDNFKDFLNLLSE